MCGIFGLTKIKEAKINSSDIRGLMNALFIHSELRGMEASGIAIKDTEAKKIRILRKSVNSRKFVNDGIYKKIVKEAISDVYPEEISLIGHTRIATNGFVSSDNQPIVKGGSIGVHNGIICNVEELWATHGELERKQVIDTELLIGLIDENINNCDGKDLFNQLEKVFSELEGSASIGVFRDKFHGLILGTNCGSLYYTVRNGILLFASEEFILKNSIKDVFGPNEVDNYQVNQLLPTSFLFFDTISGKIILSTQSKDIVCMGQHTKFHIVDYTNEKIPKPYVNKISEEKLKSLLEYNISSISKIKRCTKCILPETHTFINFDSDGVCNYCRDYEKRKSKIMKNGESELNHLIQPIKEKSGANCIFMLSGGRDSCYGLHYAKKVLGLNPIAFSYDWGMLTDLGRRNQARMCEKLGVEHVIVSADIKLKRRNIKLNVDAFLAKPHLGMMGLFMAGDKAYHYFAQLMAERYNLPLINGGCPYEYTYFKEGFATIKPSFMRSGTIWDKVDIANFFAKQAILNPRFINMSIFDNLLAFKYYYLSVLDSIKLFRYIPWNEQIVNETLINEYNWEVATDSATTWRIGDGTASFYNYIYYTVAGFTENDCFRSNLINEGKLTREEALKLVNEENRPRYDAIRWYCDTIGVDLEKAINSINNIPKLYKV
jgi:asparagine synthetase B (glutamine-hydrolysing)